MKKKKAEWKDFFFYCFSLTQSRRLGHKSKHFAFQINIKFYIPFTASDSITNRFISIVHRRRHHRSLFFFVVVVVVVVIIDDVLASSFIFPALLTFWFQFLINSSIWATRKGTKKLWHFHSKIYVKNVAVFALAIKYSQIKISSLFFRWILVLLDG